MILVQDELMNNLARSKILHIEVHTQLWPAPWVYGLTLINFPRSPTNFRQSSVENFLTNVNKLAAKTGEFARVCQRSPLKCPKYCIMCQQRSKKEVYHVKWHQSLLSRFSMMLYSKHLQLFACANIYADWRPCDKWHEDMSIYLLCYYVEFPIFLATHLILQNNLRKKRVLRFFGALAKLEQLLVQWHCNHQYFLILSTLLYKK